MDWSILSTVFSLIQTIIVIVAAVWAYFQLKEMKKGTIAQTFFSIVEVVQEPRVRQARDILMTIKNQNYNQWTENERKSAEIACSTYDNVGILLKVEVLDFRMIIDHWHNSIMKCWNRAQPMINKYREERGKDFWSGFQWLYDNCIEEGYRL